MNCGFYLKVFQEFPGNGSFNLCSLFSKHGNIFVLSAWERVGKRPGCSWESAWTYATGNRKSKV